MHLDKLPHLVVEETNKTERGFSGNWVCEDSDLPMTPYGVDFVLSAAVMDLPTLPDAPISAMDSF
ncbi:MAG: hypothetical protein WA869_19275 [Alloacidobacterium sp.]|jgi:hypothetical protein